MAVSPSSSVQHARELLAERLRDIRLDARMTARVLSAATGWHEAKTSRIESAKQPPSEDDIRAWCRACGADRDIPDLIVASRAAHSMYVEWRRLGRASTRRLQEVRRLLYERTQIIKSYCGTVVPVYLRTPAYTHALSSAIAAFREAPDDVEEAVRARINRNRIVGSGSHRFALLVEESVLRYRIGDDEVLAGQLAYLLEAMHLPAVSLGVIPFSVPSRRVWPLESFTIYDDTQVLIGLLSAQVTVTTPNEVTLYARAFEKLAGLAVYGDEARKLIFAALDAMT